MNHIASDRESCLNVFRRKDDGDNLSGSRLTSTVGDRSRSTDGRRSRGSLHSAAISTGSAAENAVISQVGRLEQGLTGGGRAVSIHRRSAVYCLGEHCSVARDELDASFVEPKRQRRRMTRRREADKEEEYQEKAGEEDYKEDISG